MNTGAKQLGSVRVSCVMKAKARQIWKAISQKGELLGDTAGLQGLPIGPATHKRLVGLPNAQREQFLGLFTLEPTQLLDCEFWQNNRPISATFCVFEAKTSFSLFETLHNAYCTVIRINVFPAQCKNLAASHARRESKHDRPIRPIAFNVLQ